MKKTFSFIMLFQCTSLIAQNSLVFNVLYKPEKVYTIELITTSNSELHFLGKREDIEKLKKIGFPLSMTGKSDNLLLSTIITGKKAENNIIPFRLEVNKNHVFTDTYTKIINEDGPLSNLVIEGHYDQEGNMRLDSLISYAKVRIPRDSLIISILKSYYEINFPKISLKKGSKFIQKMNLEIPVAGINYIQSSLVLTYTLVDINMNYAKFDIDQKFQFPRNAKESNLIMTNSGFGIAEYDIKNNILSKYETSSQFTFESKIQNVKMVLNVFYQTNQTTLIK